MEHFKEQGFTDRFNAIFHSVKSLQTPKKALF